MSPCREGGIEYQERAAALSYFIFRKMMGEGGAIYSTYHTGYPDSEKFGVNHEVLSESIGLALLYAYYARNLTLFRALLDFVEKHLLSPHGTLYWKLNPDLTPFGVGGHYSSALIDDLRVARALILGYRLWNDGRALNVSLRLSKGLANYNRGGDLVESISWSGENIYKSDKVFLSYLDLRALELLSEIDGGWRDILEASKVRILNGKRDGLFFHTFFDVKSGKYGDVFDVCDSLNQLLILDHLVDAGLKEEALPLFGFFKDRFEEFGEINGLYGPNGTAIGGVGIGTYSLFSCLALKLNERGLAKRVLESWVLSSQDLEEGSPLFGALVAKWPGDMLDANSFDNLMGAISLEMAIESQLEIGGRAYNEGVPPK